MARFGFAPFLKNIETPRQSALARAAGNLSPSLKALFALSALVMAGSVFFIANELQSATMSAVPAKGGELREGIVGSPRFINPLLAVSDADRDLSSLIYSGLMKATPEGALIPDLAESYTISEDGLVYTFVLRENARFHDGTPLTAQDVLFTIEKAQDPGIKSPRRASWEGVRVEARGEREVVFTLAAPYGPFLENTTLGILPKHLWESVGTEAFPFGKFNVEPVGSGPFKIKAIRQNETGVPVSYELAAFSDYTLGTPHLSRMTFFFYPNEEALVSAHQSGEIESMGGISPENIEGLPPSTRTLRSSLPRIFGVFFNQNHAPVLLDTGARAALIAAINQEEIVKEVLGGYGTPIDGPLPPHIATGAQVSADHTNRAREILEENGWEFSEEEGLWSKETKTETLTLSLSLSTSNAPELKRTAQMVKAAWEAIGVPVELKLFDIGELTQSVIRPRKYDALLFGEILGRSPDLYAFWHSSQRNDPGLNIALYANITADKLLEEARGTSDPNVAEEKYRLFEAEVAKDIPAAFLYSPDFIYVMPEKLHGVTLGTISVSGDRFLNVHEWYMETDQVWSFLLP